MVRNEYKAVQVDGNNLALVSCLFKFKNELFKAKTGNSTKQLFSFKTHRSQPNGITSKQRVMGSNPYKDAIIKTSEMNQ